MDDKPPPRSLLRLDNFLRALAGLKEAVYPRQSRPLTELQKADMVQRFEIAWELGWKLLADRLSEEMAPPEADPGIDHSRRARRRHDRGGRRMAGDGQAGQLAVGYLQRANP